MKQSLAISLSREATLILSSRSFPVLVELLDSIFFAEEWNFRVFIYFMPLSIFASGYIVEGECLMQSYQSFYSIIG